jgi:hypothetical protein
MSIVFSKFLDLELFNDQKLVAEYLCPLCQGVYFNPVSDPCGHLFCKECLLTSLAHNGAVKTCPILKTDFPFNDEERIIRPLIFVQEILNRMQLNCKNFCGWSGQLRDLPTHMQNNCELEMVKCRFSDCLSKKLRGEILIHEEECGFRLVYCEYCSSELPFNLLDNHYSECPKILISCPQNCNSQVQRCQIEEHLTVCDNTALACPYNRLGCLFKGVKSNMVEHNNFEQLEHSQMIAQQFEKYNEKIDYLFNEFQGVINLVKNFNSRELSEKPLERRKYKKREVKDSQRGKSVNSLKSSKSENIIKKENLNNNPNVNNHIVKKPVKRSKKEKVSESLLASLREEEEKLEKNSNSFENIINSVIETKNPPIAFVNRKRERENVVGQICTSSKGQYSNSKSHKAKNNNVILSRTDSDFQIVRNEEDYPLELDQDYLSKGISITENKATNISTSRNEHKFVFAKINLNETTSWKIKIEKRVSWMAFGLGIKEKICSNNYKFVGQSKDHGCYLISSNGYSWNSHLCDENNLALGCDFPSIENGDILHFYYEAEKAQLFFDFKGSRFVLSEVTSKDLSLSPCVLFLNYGDEVTFTK